MISFHRHSREDLERRHAEVCAAVGVSGADELWRIAGKRELTTEEDVALDELRRIEFLLGLS